MHAALRFFCLALVMMTTGNAFAECPGGVCPQQRVIRRPFFNGGFQGGGTVIQGGRICSGGVCTQGGTIIQGGPFNGGFPGEGVVIGGDQFPGGFVQGGQPFPTGQPTIVNPTIGGGGTQIQPGGTQSGSNGTFTPPPVTDPNGRPIKVTTTFNAATRQPLFAASWSINGVIATTTNFNGNSPVFAETASLGANGFAKPNTGTGTTTTTPSSPPDPTVMPSPVPPSPATDGTVKVEVRNGYLWVAQKDKPERKARFITKDEGTILEWQPDGSLKPVPAKIGDLVFEREDGEKVKFNTEARKALLKHYSDKLAGFTGEKAELVKKIIARLDESLKLPASDGPPATIPKKDGTHGTGPNAGNAAGPLRPLDTKTPPTELENFKALYDKAKEPEVTAEAVQTFAKNWNVPNTQSAVLTINCVSDINPTATVPMTLFVKHLDSGASKASIRMDVGSLKGTPDGGLEAIIKKSSEREISLAPNAAEKALRASRPSVELPEATLDYDLRMIPGDPAKFWVKITETRGTKKQEYFCGKSEPVSQKKNILPLPKLDDTSIPPPRVKTDATPPPLPKTDHTATPKVDPPKVDPPKIDPPKIDPPKVDPPKVDPPKVDPPKIDPPKLDPPKLDPPKLDPPKLDPPKLDPPKIDPPKLDPPKVDPPAPEFKPVHAFLKGPAAGNNAKLVDGEGGCLSCHGVPEIKPIPFKEGSDKEMLQIVKRGDHYEFAFINPRPDGKVFPTTLEGLRARMFDAIDSRMAKTVDADVTPAQVAELKKWLTDSMVATPPPGTPPTPKRADPIPKKAEPKKVNAPPTAEQLNEVRINRVETRLSVLFGRPVKFSKDEGGKFLVEVGNPFDADDTIAILVPVLAKAKLNESTFRMKSDEEGNIVLDAKQILNADPAIDVISATFAALETADTAAAIKAAFPPPPKK